MPRRGSRQRNVTAILSPARSRRPSSSTKPGRKSGSAMPKACATSGRPKPVSVASIASPPTDASMRNRSQLSAMAQPTSRIGVSSSRAVPSNGWSHDARTVRPVSGTATAMRFSRRNSPSIDATRSSTRFRPASALRSADSSKPQNSQSGCKSGGASACSTVAVAAPRATTLPPRIRATQSRSLRPLAAQPETTRRGPSSNQRGAAT